jgi:predicted Co/Zn/Cd cation transporter (cation efflux family)
VKRHFALGVVVGAAGAAAAVRFFSSVRVQAFLSHQGGTILAALGIAFGLVVGTMAVIWLVRIRSTVGNAGALSLVALTLVTLACAPGRLLALITDQPSLGSLLLLGAGLLGSLVGILWIRRITNEIAEPDPSTWRI